MSGPTGQLYPLTKLHTFLYRVDTNCLLNIDLRHASMIIMNYTMNNKIKVVFFRNTISSC